MALSSGAPEIAAAAAGSGAGRTDGEPATWPAGGGEMGALIRATDWASTPLGPVEGWPRSLKTMLGAVLGSRFAMVLWWGPDLIQLYNDSFRPILRDKHPAALGAPARDAWGEIWDAVGPLAAQVTGGGPAVYIEDFQLYINNGAIAEETYFTFSYSPAFGDDGAIAGMLATALETTAKVQADRQIRTRHELARRAAGARTEREAYAIAAEVLAADRLDLAFVLIYARAGAAAELIAQGGWPGAAPPPAALPLAAAGEPSWPGPEPVLVLPLARPGGAAPAAFLLAGPSPHRQLDDRYRGFFEAIAEQVVASVTAARVAEDEDRRAATLTEQRDVLDRFFQLSLDLMCIAGPDGVFRKVSPAFRTLGYDDAELTTRPFLDFVHPDDVPATLAEVARLRRGVPTLRFENRYRCKDGSYRWLAWTAAPDAEGTLYAVARDVTDARRIQDALAQAKDEAEAANKELESFSYSVAHDLRGPLRSIDGFSQALLEDYGGALDLDGKRYLTFVRESAQHMAQLIDDLLALSRVTRSEMVRTDVDLSALARSAVARLQRAQPARKVAVTIADGHHADGDPRLLAVVFDNLIGNAWKFTGRRADARIEFGATPGAGGPTYFVRDNGAGFDMSFVGKLFGVFQRLHAASEFEGTGVGLATVQRVIARHGGTVWAEAAIDRGATFHFTLPPPSDSISLLTAGEGSPP